MEEQGYGLNKLQSSNGEASDDQHEEEILYIKPAYNKSNFFDDISSESKDRQKSREENG